MIKQHAIQGPLLSSSSSSSKRVAVFYDFTATRRKRQNENPAVTTKAGMTCSLKHGIFMLCKAFLLFDSYTRNLVIVRGQQIRENRTKNRRRTNYTIEIQSSPSSEAACSAPFELFRRSSETKNNKSTTISNKDTENFARFDLQPSAVLAERQRQRRLSKNNFTLPKHWFDLENNHALYASIPDPKDADYVNDAKLHDFYAYRHLSRYEREYRRQNNQDLQKNWDGLYKFDNIQRQEHSDNLASNNLLKNNTFNHPTKRSLFASIKPDASKVNNNTTTTKHNSIVGGLYNNYQAIPLSQGYGTHFANVWVGSPTPQRKTVIVDTGSYYTAFPCVGCTHCGSAHHTDPYFDPLESKTFSQLQCDECVDNVLCSQGKCVFQQSYTEGSSWEAVQVKDRFYCSGTDVIDSADVKDSKYVIDFMFGCQTSITGLFITQLADGIMGLAAHPATLPKQLYDQHKIEHNMFAMCFRRELGTSKRGVTAGSMTIGGFSNNLDTSPMIYARNMVRLGWFTVYVKNIYIRQGGGQSAKSIDALHKTIKVNIDPEVVNSGKGVIVDSGTTDTYLSKAVAYEFYKAWRKATGWGYSHSPVSLTDKQLRALPTILIQCHSSTQQNDPALDSYDTIPGYAGILDMTSPNDLLIAIPSTSYMDYSPISKLYTSRLYFTETSGGVLGSNTMQGHNVVFDWENSRIGFAESSCAYDKSAVPNTSKSEDFDSDCSVGNPVVFQTCLDSVDERMCALNPTNIALLGTEVWSAVVESAGSEIGRSCADAATKMSKGKTSDEITISCNGKGLCEESRPCQLTCAELAQAKKVVLASKEENVKRGCGSSLWSTCDYGCMQTRIKSHAFTDGKCHEIFREDRVCHIHACARSDPCRVPYIVHAVFAFEGLSPVLWSEHSEDNFILALTKAVSSIQKASIFREGDVDITSVLPWYPDDDDPDNIPGPNDIPAKGAKVVVDISIFNDLAAKRNHSRQDALYYEDKEGIFSSFLRNLTNFDSSKKMRTKCPSKHLFESAAKALYVKNTLLHDTDFIPELLQEIEKLEFAFHEDYSESSFTPMFKNQDRKAECRVLSAWTMRTEVDDEINYLGSSRSKWYYLFKVSHYALLVVFGLLLLRSVWSTVVAWREAGLECSDVLKLITMRKNTFGNTIPENDSDEEFVMMRGAAAEHYSEVEMSTTYSSPHRKTSPKKRRNTVY